MDTTRKNHLPDKFFKWVVLFWAAILVCAITNFTVAQGSSPQAGTSKRPVDAKAADEYQLGAGDEIFVFASYADDITNKVFRISVNGDVSFRRIGMVHVVGMN